MLPTPPTSPLLHATCSPEDRIGQILPNGLQLSSILGVGAYGTVYKAYDLQTGAAYAVKALNKLGLDAKQKKFLSREIRLHQRASSHPNVLGMYQVFNFPDTSYVVLEYCPEGDLFGNITDHEQYVGRDSLVKRVFLQLLDAVEYCHSLGIYHRDLKPENVLVKDAGWTVKLADFGLATTDCVSSDFGCGSTFYMSPECLQAAPKPFSYYASAPNDVWSLGVILVNLTCGRNPWKKASVEDPTFNAFLQDSEFLKTILPLSDELDWILRSIFECDPTRRVTIAELKELITRCTSFSPRGSMITPELTDYSQESALESHFELPESFAVTGHSLATEFSHLTTSSHSSDSDSDSVFSCSSSSSSSTSSSSSSSSGFSYPQYPISIPNMASPPPVDTHSVNPANYLSTPSSWYSVYSNFFPALDLAQKRMAFQPNFFSGVRVI